MSKAVTNCPACGVSFQVTEQQLLAADDSVRCGECLHFFHAEDHFISPMLDKTEYLAIERDYWADFESYIGQVAGSGEGFVENGLAIENEASGSLQVPLWVAQITELEVGLSASSSEGYLELADTDEVYEKNDVSICARQPMSEIVGPAPSSASMVSENNWSVISKPNDSYEADESTLNFEQVGNLLTLRSLKLVSGILALLILLFLQYAYLLMEQFALEARYRAYYESTCRYLGCAVPEFRDLSRLQPRELLVRTHPTVEKALIADALLRNTSEYRQPFPNLRLRFFDINGHIVARRVFNAGEYLGGEMRGLKFIPGHTDVRLSLELVDPGKEALGYQMDVVP